MHPDLGLDSGIFWNLRYAKQGPSGDGQSPFFPSHRLTSQFTSLPSVDLLSPVLRNPKGRTKTHCEGPDLLSLAHPQLLSPPAQSQVLIFCTETRPRHPPNSEIEHPALGRRAPWAARPEVLFPLRVFTQRTGATRGASGSCLGIPQVREVLADGGGEQAECPQDTSQPEAAIRMDGQDCLPLSFPLGSEALPRCPPQASHPAPPSIQLLVPPRALQCPGCIRPKPGAPPQVFLSPTGLSRGWRHGSQTLSHDLLPPRGRISRKLASETKPGLEPSTVVCVGCTKFTLAGTLSACPYIFHFFSSTLPIMALHQGLPEILPLSSTQPRRGSESRR